MWLYLVLALIVSLVFLWEEGILQIILLCCFALLIIFSIYLYFLNKKLKAHKMPCNFITEMKSKGCQFSKRESDICFRENIFVQCPHLPMSSNNYTRTKYVRSYVTKRGKRVRSYFRSR